MTHNALLYTQLHGAQYAADFKANIEINWNYRFIKIFYFNKEKKIEDIFIWVKIQKVDNIKFSRFYFYL